MRNLEKTWEISFILVIYNFLEEPEGTPSPCQCVQGGVRAETRLLSGDKRNGQELMTRKLHLNVKNFFTVWDCPGRASISLTRGILELSGHNPVPHALR